jgi:hypothetical protein
MILIREGSNTLANINKDFEDEVTLKFTSLSLSLWLYNPSDGGSVSRKAATYTLTYLLTDLSPF